MQAEALDDTIEATRLRTNLRLNLSIYSTCEQLAQIASVPIETACDWRHGLGVPSMEQTVLLAKALRFSIDDLFLPCEYRCECGRTVAKHERHY